MESNINRINQIVEDLNNEIDFLIEQSFSSTDDDTKKDDISSIRKDIEYLRSKLYGDNNLKDTLGFRKITIRFDNEYQLKLPKYGIEEFDRVLKGDMYFSVVGGNESYLELRTSSMPPSFKIILYYETLREFKRQNGDAYLYYSRGRERLTGESESVSYKIIEKI